MLTPREWNQVKAAIMAIPEVEVSQGGESCYRLVCSHATLLRVVRAFAEEEDGHEPPDSG